MQNMFNLKRAAFIGSIFITLSSAVVLAEELPNYDLGVRFDGNLSGGSPANDILGFSVTGRYRLNDDWLVGAAIESAAFDYERPYKDLGFESFDPNTGEPLTVDADVDSLMFSAWAERRYNEKVRGGYWFWTAGAGLNTVDVKDLAGTREGGESFNLTTDVDTELVLTATAGRRHNLSDAWTVGYGLRLEQRFGDWTVTDTTTGIKTTTIDGYSVHGLFLETNYRF